jgi:hypothetical protein
VWVSGGKTPPARDVEEEQVTLIPNAKEYKPGDTAELLVQAPFYPAEGVMSVRRSGIVTSTRFTMTGPTHKLTVPITDGYTPNLYVQVDLIGMSARVGDDGQPDTGAAQAPGLRRRQHQPAGAAHAPHARGDDRAADRQARARRQDLARGHGQGRRRQAGQRAPRSR